MKIKILIALIFYAITGFSQNELCRENIIDKNQIVETNEIEKYTKYDFSNLWTQTKNELVYGIIGTEYERILVKIILVERNSNNLNEYLVYGKSNVKSNICDFLGKITILKIQELNVQNFGVDDEFKNYGIEKQGVLTAKYEFYENNEQNHSGLFKGILQSKWYLDKNDEIIYNDIDSFTDGYFNNAFVGTWKMYNSIIEKVCNWADYRVPSVNCDFDIGAAELSVSEKYSKNGWWVKPIKDWWK